MALMLKDYLHLDSSSDTLTSSQSKNALAMISAIFNAVKNLPFNTKDHWPRPPSLSKTLRTPKFWKKKPPPETAEIVPIVRVRDIVRERSFCDEGEESRRFPLLRSCSSSSSELEFRKMDHLFRSSIASCDSFKEIVVDGENCSSPRSSQLNWGKNSGYTVTEEKEGKEMVDYESENEQEQLSPVSVMDFPSEKEEEEEEGETATISNSSSPSFHQTLANIERSKLELLDKIRLFESLAELNPTILDRCFERDDGSCSSSINVEPLDLEGEDDGDAAEAKKALALLELIKASNYLVVGPTEGCFEKLLIDFFTEGLSYHDEEELLDRARCWIVGEKDENGKKLRREMERNGEWKCFDEEMERLGVDLEGIVFGSLLEELVVDI